MTSPKITYGLKVDVPLPYERAVERVLKGVTRAA